MTAKQFIIQDIKLVDFPEEVDVQNGIKIYGETSWENQLAVLSHYLHNNDCIGNEQNKKEILYTIREFLERKKSNKEETITEEYVMKVAENPVEYSLFSDFFRVPFPSPQSPQFTFIDCLRVWEVFVWQCKHKEENVFFLQNGINMLKKLIWRTSVKCHLEI